MHLPLRTESGWLGLLAQIQDTKVHKHFDGSLLHEDR